MKLSYPASMADVAVTYMRAFLREEGRDELAAPITCHAALFDWIIEILDVQAPEITNAKRKRVRRQLRRIIANLRAMVPDNGGRSMTRSLIPSCGVGFASGARGCSGSPKNRRKHSRTADTQRRARHIAPALVEATA